MPKCTLNVARMANGYLMRVEGKGTSYDSPAVAAFVRRYLQTEPQPRIAIDLSRCEFLDSTFLGCLLNLHRECKEKAPASFTVIADAAHRKKLLFPTRVDSVLQISESSPEPVSRFLVLDPKKLDRRTYGWHIVETHRALAGAHCPGAHLYEQIADSLAHELERSPAQTDPPADQRETF